MMQIKPEFEAKIVRVGTSKAVVIPSEYMKLLGFELGDRLILEIKDHHSQKSKDAVLGFQTHFSDFDYLNQGVEV